MGWSGGVLWTGEIAVSLFFSFLFSWKHIRTKICDLVCGISLDSVFREAFFF